MNYVVYFSRGGKREIGNVAKVYENKHTVRFVLTDGFEVNVIKKYLLHYEPRSLEQFSNKESIQDIFQRFDDFVDNFIDKFEKGSNISSRYSINIKQIKGFKNLMDSYKITPNVKSLKLKP